MFKSGFSGAIPDVLASIQRYDPGLARQRLPEAGFPDGKEFAKLDFWLRNTFTTPAFGRASSGATIESESGALGRHHPISRALRVFRSPPVALPGPPPNYIRAGC